MSLSFANASRSFIDTLNGVRFIGYDGMISVPFLIDKGALETAGPITNTEASFLSAFDRSRKLIYSVASEIYAQSRQTSYKITARNMV